MKYVEMEYCAKIKFNLTSIKEITINFRNPNCICFGSMMEVIKL